MLDQNKAWKEKWITPTMFWKNQGTNLSVFEGDLPDQRHALVLGPGVNQVKVGEWAEVDHVRYTLSNRLVDHIVPAQALRLRYRTVKGGWFRFFCATAWLLKLEGLWHKDLIWLIFGSGSEDGRLTQRLPRMCSHLGECWQLFRMCGSYPSPFYQRNLWCFFCSSVQRERHYITTNVFKIYWDSFRRLNVCFPLTSKVWSSSIDCNSFTGSTCCWRMKSAIATTDLWPLYSLFIIIPLRNNFNVGYLEMRYRWAMSAAQKQRS